MRGSVRSGSLLLRLPSHQWLLQRLVLAGGIPSLAAALHLALRLMLLVQISETVILFMTQSLEVREVSVVLQIGMEDLALVVHQLPEGVFDFCLFAKGAGDLIVGLLTLADSYAIGESLALSV